MADVMLQSETLFLPKLKNVFVACYTEQTNYPPGSGSPHQGSRLQSATCDENQMINKLAIKIFSEILVLVLFPCFTGQNKRRKKFPSNSRTILRSHGKFFNSKEFV